MNVFDSNNEYINILSLDINENNFNELSSYIAKLIADRAKINELLISIQNKLNDKGYLYMETNDVINPIEIVDLVKEYKNSIKKFNKVRKNV